MIGYYVHFIDRIRLSISHVCVKNVNSEYDVVNLMNWWRAIHLHLTWEWKENEHEVTEDNEINITRWLIHLLYFILNSLIIHSMNVLMDTINSNFRNHMILVYHTNFCNWKIRARELDRVTALSNCYWA